MSTLTGLHVPEVKEFIQKKWKKATHIRRKYKVEDIIVLGSALENDDIENKLIDIGLPVSQAENMTRTIARVRKVGDWYLSSKNQLASEHEIRTFLVVPFLKSIGWPEQRIGIEVARGRARIDIILYKDAARKIPLALVETKKIWSGLVRATIQLEKYAKKYPTVKYLITTTGLRYSLNEKYRGKWIQTAYMNFGKMLDRHSCYPKIGGVFYFLNKLFP